MEKDKLSKVRSEISGRKGTMGNTCLLHVSREGEGIREEESGRLNKVFKACLY